MTQNGTTRKNQACSGIMPFRTVPWRSPAFWKMTMPQDVLQFRSREAASYLGISASTLAKMRMRGDGPAFIKAGSRIVLYAKADIDAWLATRRRSSTSVKDPN